MSQHDEVRCADAEYASYDADHVPLSFEHDAVPSSEDEDEISSEEDDYNDNEDNKQAIYEGVIACLELFSRFTGQADLSHTSAKSEEIDDQRPRERAEFMKDMERSFNLWIDYTGALAADVNRSLDMRLQGYKDIKGMSVELLEMLARNLEYLKKTEKRGPISPIDSELQSEAVNSIRHAVEELHFMASVIRRSSVRSQNYSLSSGFERDDDSYFENYAFLIIRHTFPHARRSLCKQLGASIALRRKRLRRKIQHEEKLKTRRTPGQVSTNPAQANPIAQSPPSRPQSGPSPMSPSSPRQVEGPVNSPRSTDTRSNLNAAMARRGLKARSAFSTISMGSSVRLSERKYPPKPHFQPGATDCACPYCARRLATVKLSNIPTFWDDHLDEDVQPYICLSEECTSPLLFFVHMKQWVDHMNSVHSEQWTRRIHMSTWYCDTNHKAEQFNDLESFMQHMKDPANHPGRPPPSDLQLDTLSRNKQKALTREDEYSCPFCDCIPDKLRPVIPTSAPNAIRHQLHKHIASHIKNLAVLSIPILTTTETPKSKSSESKDEEKGRRLKEGEEASYPSGYDEELYAVIFSDNEDLEEMPPLDISETQDTHWHDVGFIEWYKSEEARVNTSGPKTDLVLQEFIRAQGIPDPPTISSVKMSGKDSSITTELRGKIIGAFLHDLDPEQTFIPEDTLRKLIVPDDVTKILEECRSQMKRKITISDLSNFIITDAYKVFAIFVWVGYPHLIENFYQPDFSSELLPCKYREPKIGEWVVESHTEKTIFSYDDEYQWDHPQILVDFCATWQWPFVAPVFVEEKFRYAFPSKIRLPFTKTWKQKQDSLSKYSEVVAKSIHHSHLQTTLQTALDEYGNRRIALERLKTNSKEKAEQEAKALESRNGFASDHLIKTIAYYQVSNTQHYFMFPWPERGNLWEFLLRQEMAPPLDRQYMVRLFRQFRGLACALDELSNHNIRHGDLKPDNIVCFEAKDGLPEPNSPSVRLVIIHSGLYMTHKDFGDTDTRVWTRRYGAPELGDDYTRAKSRRFDVWAMGCIFLEIVVWLLNGKEGLVEFTEALGADKFYKKTRTGEEGSEAQMLTVRDQGSQKTEDNYEVHPRVRDEISAIMEDDRCSEGTALRSLVNLIDKKLLVVELRTLKPPAIPTPQPSAPGAKDEIITLASQPGAPDVMIRAPTVPSTGRASTIPMSDTTESSNHRVFARDMMEELEDILDKLERGTMKPVGRGHGKHTPNSTGLSQAQEATSGHFLGDFTNNPAREHFRGSPQY